MFADWSFFSGIEHAIEMLFVIIAVLSNGMAGDMLMEDVYSVGRVR